MYVARKVSIYMLYKCDVLMTSALPFATIFWQMRNKDVKVGPCLMSKLQLLKLPCFWSLIIEIWRQYNCIALWDLLKIIMNIQTKFRYENIKLIIWTKQLSAHILQMKYTSHVVHYVRSEV